MPYFPSPRAGGDGSGFPIVVHCHLRWSFVWQRPQQIHSRLAASHPVLFVEEPLESDDTTGRLELTSPFPNVTVAVPRVTASREDSEAATLELLREFAASPRGERFSNAVHWLYTPMMEPQIWVFGAPAAIVYDCMDELTNFAFAPPDLAPREDVLLKEADVVFTGGHQLYLSKKKRNSNTHFFGCGVDFDHFASASNAAVAQDLAPLPRPCLGYVGVIDERLDYALLDELAAELPDATLAMVGPVVKVDPATLPQRANVHYLGAKPYQALPSYVAGFDVCLMPFALNDASRFINPTKTLEYLASGRPVLSTPVADVVTNFGHAVHISPPEAFAERARDILAGKRLDPERGLDEARRSSWEKRVQEMELLVQEALASVPTAAAAGR
jgi:glycosyltransferase involved in cell wall biosynthesis